MLGGNKMKKYSAGFIGAGNMGGALATAVCRVKNPTKVAIKCKTEEKTLAVAGKLGCNYGTIEDITSNSRFVFLGVKPGMVAEIADECKQYLHNDSVVISMLAGVTLEKLETLFGKSTKIIRIMPNTPCTVGSGIILYTKNMNVSDEDLSDFKNILSGAGLLDEISENLIDIAGTITGCGPAFAYLFIESLADGAVACGLQRAKALQYISQMLVGSAQMVLQTGKHPDLLKDEVCSPGGSTIQGVAELERGKLRATCIDAVIASYEKTKQLG